MVSIEVLALVLTGFSITASIVYYANVLSNANKTQQLQLETRKAQLYMQILDRFSSEENRLRSIEVLQMDVKDYEDYRENWSMYKNPEAAAKRFHVWTEIDGLGQLLSEGLISIDFIPAIIYRTVKLHWEKYGPIIKEIRNREGGEQRNRNVYFEYFYNEIIKYQNENPEIIINR
jgi:hypothetical protein